MQCQSIKLIVSILFIFIDAIDSVDRIYRINVIDHGVLSCSELQLKDKSNDPINSGVIFWGKKGEILEVTEIYWNL